MAVPPHIGQLPGLGRASDPSQGRQLVVAQPHGPHGGQHGGMMAQPHGPHGAQHGGHQMVQVPGGNPIARIPSNASSVGGLAVRTPSNASSSGTAPPGREFFPGVMAGPPSGGTSPILGTRAPGSPAGSRGYSPAGSPFSHTRQLSNSSDPMQMMLAQPRGPSIGQRYPGGPGQSGLPVQLSELPSPHLSSNSPTSPISPAASPASQASQIGLPPTQGQAPRPTGGINPPSWFRGASNTRRDGSVGSTGNPEQSQPGSAQSRETTETREPTKEVSREEILTETVSISTVTVSESLVQSQAELLYPPIVATAGEHGTHPTLQNTAGSYPAELPVPDKSIDVMAVYPAGSFRHGSSSSSILQPGGGSRAPSLGGSPSLTTKAPPNSRPSSERSSSGGGGGGRGVRSSSPKRSHDLQAVLRRTFAQVSKECGAILLGLALRAWAFSIAESKAEATEMAAVTLAAEQRQRFSARMQWLLCILMVHHDNALQRLCFCCWRQNVRTKFEIGVVRQQFAKTFANALQHHRTVVHAAITRWSGVQALTQMRVALYVWRKELESKQGSAATFTLQMKERKRTREIFFKNVECHVIRNQRRYNIHLTRLFIEIWRCQKLLHRQVGQADNAQAEVEALMKANKADLERMRRQHQIDVRGLLQLLAVAEDHKHLHICWSRWVHRSNEAMRARLRSATSQRVMQSMESRIRQQDFGILEQGFVLWRQTACHLREHQRRWAKHKVTLDGVLIRLVEERSREKKEALLTEAFVCWARAGIYRRKDRENTSYVAERKRLREFFVYSIMQVVDSLERERDQGCLYEVFSLWLAMRRKANYDLGTKKIFVARARKAKTVMEECQLEACIALWRCQVSHNMMQQHTAMTQSRLDAYRTRSNFVMDQSIELGVIAEMEFLLQFLLYEWHVIVARERRGVVTLQTQAQQQKRFMSDRLSMVLLTQSSEQDIRSMWLCLTRWQYVTVTALHSTSKIVHSIELQQRRQLRRSDIDTLLQRRAVVEDFSFVSYVWQSWRWEIFGKRLQQSMSKLSRRYNGHVIELLGLLTRNDTTQIKEIIFIAWQQVVVVQQQDDEQLKLRTVHREVAHKALSLCIEEQDVVLFRFYFERWRVEALCGLTDRKEGVVSARHLVEVLRLRTHFCYGIDNLIRRDNTLLYMLHGIFQEWHKRTYLSRIAGRRTLIRRWLERYCVDQEDKAVLQSCILQWTLVALGTRREQLVEAHEKLSVSRRHHAGGVDNMIQGGSKQTKKIVLIAWQREIAVAKAQIQTRQNRLRYLSLINNAVSKWTDEREVVFVGVMVWCLLGSWRRLAESRRVFNANQALNAMRERYGQHANTIIRVLMSGNHMVGVLVCFANWRQQVKEQVHLKLIERGRRRRGSVLEVVAAFWADDQDLLQLKAMWSCWVETAAGQRELKLQALSSSDLRRMRQVNLDNIGNCFFKIEVERDAAAVEDTFMHWQDMVSQSKSRSKSQDKSQQFMLSHSRFKANATQHMLKKELDGGIALLAMCIGVWQQDTLEGKHKKELDKIRAKLAEEVDRRKLVMDGVTMVWNQENTKALSATVYEAWKKVTSDAQDDATRQAMEVARLERDAAHRSRLMSKTAGMLEEHSTQSLWTLFFAWREHMTSIRIDRLIEHGESNSVLKAQMRQVSQSVVHKLTSEPSMEVMHCVLLWRQCVVDSKLALQTQTRRMRRYLAADGAVSRWELRLVWSRWWHATLHDSITRHQAREHAAEMLSRRRRGYVYKEKLVINFEMQLTSALLSMVIAVWWREVQVCGINARHEDHALHMKGCSDRRVAATRSVIAWLNTGDDAMLLSMYFLSWLYNSYGNMLAVQHARAQAKYDSLSERRRGALAAANVYTFRHFAQGTLQGILRIWSNCAMVGKYESIISSHIQEQKALEDLLAETAAEYAEDRRVLLDRHELQLLEEERQRQLHEDEYQKLANRHTRSAMEVLMRQTGSQSEALLKAVVQAWLGEVCVGKQVKVAANLKRGHLSFKQRYYDHIELISIRLFKGEIQNMWTQWLQKVYETKAAEKRAEVQDQMSKSMGLVMRNLSSDDRLTDRRSIMLLWRREVGNHYRYAASERHRKAIFSRVMQVLDVGDAILCSRCLQQWRHHVIRDVSVRESQDQNLLHVADLQWLRHQRGHTAECVVRRWLMERNAIVLLETIVAMRQAVLVVRMDDMRRRAQRQLVAHESLDGIWLMRTILVHWARARLHIAHSNQMVGRQRRDRALDCMLLVNADESKFMVGLAVLHAWFRAVQHDRLSHEMVSEKHRLLVRHGRAALAVIHRTGGLQQDAVLRLSLQQWAGIARKWHHDFQFQHNKEFHRLAQRHWRSVARLSDCLTAVQKALLIRVVTLRWAVYAVHEYNIREATTYTAQRMGALHVNGAKSLVARFVSTGETGAKGLCFHGWRYAVLSTKEALAAVDEEKARSRQLRVLLAQALSHCWFASHHTLAKTIYFGAWNRMMFSAHEEKNRARSRKECAVLEERHKLVSSLALLAWEQDQLVTWIHIILKNWAMVAARSAREVEANDLAGTHGKLRDLLRLARGSRSAGVHGLVSRVEDAGWLFAVHPCFSSWKDLVRQISDFRGQQMIGEMRDWTQWRLTTMARRALCCVRSEGGSVARCTAFMVWHNSVLEAHRALRSQKTLEKKHNHCERTNGIFLRWNEHDAYLRRHIFFNAWRDFKASTWSNINVTLASDRRKRHSHDMGRSMNRQHALQELHLLGAILNSWRWHHDARHTSTALEKYRGLHSEAVSRGQRVMERAVYDLSSNIYDLHGRLAFIAWRETAQHRLRMRYLRNMRHQDVHRVLTWGYSVEVLRACFLSWKLLLSERLRLQFKDDTQNMVVLLYQSVMTCKELRARLLAHRKEFTLVIVTFQGWLEYHVQFLEKARNVSQVPAPGRRTAGKEQQLPDKKPVYGQRLMDKKPVSTAGGAELR